MTSITNLKKPGSLDQTLESAFPDVDAGEIPLGSMVLLQIKQAPTKTSGGILLAKHDIETEFDNTQVAKVILLGSIAYKSRETMVPWPEGAWVERGDYVRISQHQGKRWTVPMPGTRGQGIEQRITFALVDDLHISSLVTDPLAVKAFF